MLTSIQNFNKSLFNLATSNLEEGLAEAADIKECISALFHEDTEEFFLDYDLIKSDAFN